MLTAWQCVYGTILNSTPVNSTPEIVLPKEIDFPSANHMGKDKVGMVTLVEAVCGQFPGHMDCQEHDPPVFVKAA